MHPFGTIHEFEGKLYIQTGKKKEVAKQVAVNPKVELSGFDGEKWIRVAATLVLDDRPEVQESMLEAYPQLRGMYTAGDGNTAVYYLKDATATFSAFGGEAEVIKF